MNVTPVDPTTTRNRHSNQQPPSHTPSPPLQLPETRHSMSIPNYKQLQETLTTAQQRANWLAPHWQLYQNLSIQHPTTRQYLQALDEAHLPNQEMLPDSAQEYLARAMATTGFPFSSIKSISHHTYQNKNIWRIALTKLPGSFRPNPCSQEYTNMHMQHPKAGSSGSYCWDVFFPAAKIFWGWISPPLAFSARRLWTPHRMLS